MRPLIILPALVILSLTLSVNSRAQLTPWFWLQPYPQGNLLRASAIADSQTFAFVGDYGAFLLTTDGGDHWAAIMDSINGITDSLVAVAFGDQRCLVVANGRTSLLRSTNLGVSWSTHAVVASRYIRNIRYGGSTFVAAGDTILVSTDNGISWNTRDGPDANLLDVVDDTTWFIADTNTVYRSDDGGLSWSPIETSAVRIASLDFYSKTLGSYCAGDLVVTKTTDGGSTWFDQTVDSEGQKGKFAFIDSLVGQYICELPMPHTRYAGIFETTDGGATWTIVKTVPSDRFIDISSNAGRTIVLGELGNGYLDGRKKILSSMLLNIVDISFLDSRRGFLGGNRRSYWQPEVDSSGDGGQQWEFYDLSDYTSELRGIYMDMLGYRLYRIGGEMIGQGVLGYIFLYRTINDVIFIDSSNGWAVGDSLYGTTNGGIDWTSAWFVDTLNAVSFWDTNRGIVAGMHKLLLTNDAGLNWDEHPSSAALLSVVTPDAFTAFCGGDGGLMIRTTNGGVSWDTLDTHTTSPISRISFVSPLTGCALAGSDVLVTTDGGAAWEITRPPTSVTLRDIQMVRYQGAPTLAGAVVPDAETRFSRFLQEAAIDADDPLIYAVGDKGSILVAGVNGFSSKTWNGSHDTSWFVDSNWTPVGVPLPGDSVVIPDVGADPVIHKKQNQITIAGLMIETGATLTIDDSLSRLSILGDITILGTLQLRPAASLTNILVGGSWQVGPAVLGSGAGNSLAPGSPLAGDLGFIPGHSTVFFTGTGTTEGVFYNLVIDTLSQVSSSSPVSVLNNCFLYSDFDLRPQDSLLILSKDPGALFGDGLIRNGTISRTIDSTTTQPYRFESNRTAVAFYSDSGQMRPGTVSMRTMPDTPPTEFHLQSGWNVLSIPYVVPDLRKSTLFPTSTSPARWFDPLTGYVVDDTLRYGRGYWLKFDAPETVSVYEEVPSVIDTVANVLTADSVDKFSYWVVRTPRPIVSGVAVNRLYEIGAAGTGLDYLGTLKLRYEQGEVPPGLNEDSLRLTRYEERLADTIDVLIGWNMIGSLGRPITPSMITSNPPGMVTSNFFGFDGSYYHADTLKPIFGYWVKVAQAGQLILAWDTTGASAGRICVVRTDEIPPGPLDGGSTTADLPREYHLEQSYPNPFNAGAIIRYALPEESRVTLTVYNTLGQVVAVLSDGIEAAGYKAARWDGAVVSSGVYYYTLDATSTADPARSFTRTMKMALVK